MNDDPTQLFPETHWKRYATEPVSVPKPNFGHVASRRLTTNLPTAAITTRTTQKLVKLPTQPLLN